MEVISSASSAMAANSVPRDTASAAVQAASPWIRVNTLVTRRRSWITNPTMLPILKHLFRCPNYTKAVEEYWNSFIKFTQWRKNIQHLLFTTVSFGKSLVTKKVKYGFGNCTTMVRGSGWLSNRIVRMFFLSWIFNVIDFLSEMTVDSSWCKVPREHWTQHRLTYCKWFNSNE